MLVLVLFCIFAYLFASTVIFFASVGIEQLENEDHLMPLLPNELHKHTKMNWLGSICTSIMLFILIPAVWVGDFLYFIFHIERTEQNDR